jgi:uncharacterized membrane protein
MNAEQTQQELSRYLASLEARLSDAPGDARAEILDDERTHAADALEQGRSIEQVLGSLGEVEATAAQYRSELGLSGEPPANIERAARILHGAHSRRGREYHMSCLTAVMIGGLGRLPG